MRAAGTFPDGPNIGRRRLQPFVDADVAAIAQLDADLLQSDPGRVGNASNRDQQVAASDPLLTGGCTHG